MRNCALFPCVSLLLAIAPACDEPCVEDDCQRCLEPFEECTFGPNDDPDCPDGVVHEDCGGDPWSCYSMINGYDLPYAMCTRECTTSADCGEQGTCYIDLGDSEGACLPN